MLTSLEPLPFPVYFICRHPSKWADLLNDPGAIPPTVDDLYERIVDNEDCWTVQTYLVLRHCGLDVRFTDRFVPGSVCVVNALDLGIRNYTWNSFVIACRSDGFDPVLADVVVVQNQRQKQSARDHYIPHWPQPGLVPRAPERASRVETVVFKGDPKNLLEPFHSAQFERDLHNIGLRLVIDGKDSISHATWNDYSTADVVLAVRDLGIRESLAKPASKLVNAWLAGVPAILGPEPAFRDLRRSPLDYIEATGPDQALAGLRMLVEHPGIFQGMVDNGRARAPQFTPDALASWWHNLLGGDVATRFHAWSQQSQVAKAARFSGRATSHHRSMARAQRDQVAPERILG